MCKFFSLYYQKNTSEPLDTGTEDMFIIPNYTSNKTKFYFKTEMRVGTYVVEHSTREEAVSICVMLLNSHFTTNKSFSPVMF